jgi:hypothetical protein
MATASEKDLASPRRRLDEARENLRLIQERKPAYVLSVKAPPQLDKEERRLIDEIAGLEQQLGIQRIAESAPMAATALHQLPTPPADFTGRETELAELHAALDAHGGATICGLRGLGGNGKTTLALKLTEGPMSQYHDAQFFLDLKGAGSQPSSAAEAMNRIVRAYYPKAKLPESEAELAGLYRWSCMAGGRSCYWTTPPAAGRSSYSSFLPALCCWLFSASTSPCAVWWLATWTPYHQTMRKPCSCVSLPAWVRAAWPRLPNYAAARRSPCAWLRMHWPNTRTSAQPITCSGWPTCRRGWNWCMPHSA